MQAGKQGSGTGRIKRKPCIIFFTVVIAVILLISLLVIFLVVLKEYQEMHKIISLRINTGGAPEDPTYYKNATNYLDDIGGKKLSRQYSYFPVGKGDENVSNTTESVLKTYVMKATGYGYADVFLFDEYLRGGDGDKIVICTSVYEGAEEYSSTISEYVENFSTICQKEIKSYACERFEFKKCEIELNNPTYSVAVAAYKEAGNMKTSYLNDQNKNSYGSSVPETVYIKPPIGSEGYDESWELLMYFYQYVERCIEPKFDESTPGGIDFGIRTDCETSFCSSYETDSGEKYPFCQDENSQGEVDI